MGSLRRTGIVLALGLALGGSGALAGEAGDPLRETAAALFGAIPETTEVRGRGLMLGAVLRPEHAGKAATILDHAARHGLLMLQAGPDVLRFVPALNITDADIAEGLARLRAGVARVAREVE